ncbi:S1/P1 nuclease [Tahibacter harae]|uniref:S1/P1 nuclease n=1 Tax=Tahibacter harae TaxID=2963937 RepID=A0ABT1QYQ5_9GAMM|nr:S1/P1 nuclease [Tahibacter harae]MCQ4167403.1 S1/P1 nuclease [Tahibacter harae]
MSLRQLFSAVLAVAGLISAGTAAAWGPLGHRTIAGMAQERLSEPVRREVRNLLQPDNESTLVDIATWADDLRDIDPARARATGKLHYVNFSSAQCRYTPQRDCRKGECVVASIEHYSAVLADRSRPRAERADALRFVSHFVADAHQPLHASFKPDKGGNSVQLRYGREGRTRNLHSVWDSLILNSSGLRWPQYAQTLQRGIRPPAAMGDATAWAEESCRVVRDEAVYPDGNRIDDAWLQRQRPLAEQRLQLAAVRLADLLERLLGPAPR